MKTMLVLVLGLFFALGNPALATEKVVSKKIASNFYCKGIPYGRNNATREEINSMAYAMLITLPANLRPTDSEKHKVHITVGKRTSKVCVEGPPLD